MGWVWSVEAMTRKREVACLKEGTRWCAAMVLIMAFEWMRLLAALVPSHDS
jgi:hypothetical protein